jgi:hypothetical protein
MILKFLFTVALLAVSTSTIGIPLSPMVSRCMIAYTDDNYETLKLDVKLPTLPEQVNGEAYQI